MKAGVQLLNTSVLRKDSREGRERRPPVSPSAVITVIASLLELVGEDEPEPLTDLFVIMVLRLIRGRDPGGLLIVKRSFELQMVWHSIEIDKVAASLLPLLLSSLKKGGQN
jgi:hypothetical protein